MVVTLQLSLLSAYLFAFLPCGFRAFLLLFLILCFIFENIFYFIYIKIFNSFILKSEL